MPIGQVFYQQPIKSTKSICYRELSIIAPMIPSAIVVVPLIAFVIFFIAIMIISAIFMIITTTVISGDKKYLVYFKKLPEC
jgi:hypothetical protein